MLVSGRTSRVGDTNDFTPDSTSTRLELATSGNGYSFTAWEGASFFAKSQIVLDWIGI